MAGKKPNGKITQFPTRVMYDDPQPPERQWRKIQFGEFYPSLDPNQPPAYLMDVQGQRSDEVVFTVKVALDKRKIDMIPSPSITMRVLRDAMQNALNQLQTFKDCACTLNTSCPEHRTH